MTICYSFTSYCLIISLFLETHYSNKLSHFYFLIITQSLKNIMKKNKTFEQKKRNISLINRVLTLKKKENLFI